MGNLKFCFRSAGRRFLLHLRCVALIIVFGASFLYPPNSLQAASDIVNTKHNLSVTGPGTIRSLTETRICVFCHTPHNATPGTPLWNKEIQPQTYSLYTSSTLRSGPLPQPYGPTKLCLSCHDGTIALGTVAGGVNLGLSSALPSTSPSYLGLNLSAHHPVSFPYNASRPDNNPELVPIAMLPIDLEFGGSDYEVHCTTCHNPHDDTNGMFLTMDNRYSALCIKCHQMAGWSTSSHATSPKLVNKILPIPPKTWPTWSTVAEWGCEICHTPHFAATPQLLLNYTSEAFCASCHSGSGSTSAAVAASKSTSASIKVAFSSLRGKADIRSQINKRSGHHAQPGIGSSSLQSAKTASRSTISTVTCVDCHNPHETNVRPATAPDASGMLQGVRGVDRNGMEIRSVTYEYELCFKCHSDSAQDIPYIPRVINTTNMRLAFDPSNPSYHPVVGMGKVVSVPSIPSTVEPRLRASDIIYCTDCHHDDSGGSRGPHGSSFVPILGERYETNDGTLESYQNYALCYRCHDRTSILNDVSFKKKIRRTTATGGGHSGHLAAGAPCSACHDPHGINLTFAVAAQGTGSHTHLINFDTRIVMPVPGGRYPVFTDNGTSSGSCTLVCHGKVHKNESYP